MTIKLREEILKTAHLDSSKKLARQYFEDSNIDFSKLEMNDFEKLRSIINQEIGKLLDDPEYQMIPKLLVKEKIKKTKDGIFLRISGSYFSDREAISFNYNPLFIGFAAEMSGCNHAPFIKGFVKWVDLTTNQ